MVASATTVSATKALTAHWGIMTVAHFYDRSGATGKYRGSLAWCHSRSRHTPTPR